jgi:membrane protein
MTRFSIRSRPEEGLRMEQNGRSEDDRLVESGPVDEAVPLATDGPIKMIRRVWRASQAHRTTGHAAEMAFFAVLTLVPSTIAVGALLGLSEKLIGPLAVNEAERAVTSAVRVLIGPELTDAVIAPFVHQQLSQPKGGVAIGFLIVAWWLSSHLFAATGHALDFCYGVQTRRPSVVQRFIALAFALASVVIVALTVELMVNGPLGREGGVVRGMGLLDIYTLAWSVMRWPLLFGIVVGFLMCLYRFSPNVMQGWRECLPGALLGAVFWILAAVGFRIAAAFGLNRSGGVDQAIQIIGQSVNAVVATVIWAYLASIAILLGAEFNAVFRDRRSRA